MKSLIKFIKIILNTFITLILLLIFLTILVVFNPVQKIDSNTTNNIQSTLPFRLESSDINYDKSNNTSTIERQEILNRAKAMVEVKWTPKQNIVDKYAIYAFIKGKTYYGVPYSMDSYQITSVEDFQSKISDSSVLYGNDCSGFVSAAWGISRQTTLSVFNAVKNASKIDGKTVSIISWEELAPGDALLLDDGKGKGHIMLYIDLDSKDSDKVNVYEQNVQTLFPFQPIPVARKDVRSKSSLIKGGYIPITLT